MEHKKPTIRDLRIQQGMKPGELAQKANVSFSTINRIERQHSTGVSKELVVRVLRVLDEKLTLNDIEL